MILVTGGTGLLGSFVVQELKHRGHKVRLLTRGASEQRARALVDADGEVALGDLADVESVRRACQGVDGIVHAACTFWDHQIDIRAMESLVHAWDQGAFVFISSVDVYGPVQGGPIVEDQPTLLPGASSYGAAKVHCETLLKETADRRGRRDWTILRPPHIWAPDPRCLHHQASPTSELYTRVRQGQAMVLPGATEMEWRQYGDAWIDARELAAVAVTCLEQPLVAAANAINGHFIWYEFCIELIRLTGSTSSIMHKDLAAITAAELASKAFFANTWHYSGTYLQQCLQFQPTHCWQDTLKQAIENDG